MMRGEIRVVDFEPARPGEAGKRRPAVLVSNDGANAMAALRGRGVVTVIPVTKNVERIHPFQVFLPAAQSGLDKDSKAQAEQVRAVAVDRVHRKLGSVPASLMDEVDDALRLHLGL